MIKTKIILSILSLFLIFVDQFTKYIADTYLEYAQHYYVFNQLDWFLIYNKGAAFSFLANEQWGIYVLILASVVGSILFAYLAITSQTKLPLYSYMLVFSGAVGNLWDRVMDNYVIDFIAFHYEQYYFATFNVADALINIGVLLFIINFFVEYKESKRQNKKNKNA